MIDLILEYFILRRWRKRANSYRSLFTSGGSRATARDDFGALRATNLCRVATELASTCLHGDDYEYPTKMFKEMLIEVDRRKEDRNALNGDTTSNLVLKEAPIVDPTQVQYIVTITNLLCVCL